MRRLAIVEEAGRRIICHWVLCRNLRKAICWWSSSNLLCHWNGSVSSTMAVATQGTLLVAINGFHSKGGNSEAPFISYNLIKFTIEWWYTEYYLKLYLYLYLQSVHQGNALKLFRLSSDTAISGTPRVTGIFCMYDLKRMAFVSLQETMPVDYLTGTNAIPTAERLSIVP